MKPSAIKSWGKLWLIALVLCGVVLRLVAYANTTSFWKDEVGLAENFLHRDLATIHQPFTNKQVAPVGFVEIAKELEITFGHSEHTFWLISLIGSIALLGLGVKVWKNQLPSAVLIILVGLVAFNRMLIMYTTQFKPYMTDALSALALCGVFWAWRGNPSRQNKLIYLLVGLLTLWISYTSVFVIAGLGLALIWQVRQNKKELGWWAIAIHALLAIVFGCFYLLNYQYLDPHGFFRGFWKAHFATFNPTWYFQKIPDLAFYFSGPGLELITLLFMGVGIGRAQKDYRAFLPLLLPIGLTWLASLTHAYPLDGRLVLFWLPLLLPFVAIGIYTVYQNVLKSRKTMVLILAILFVIPYSYAGIKKWEGNNFQQLRPIAEVIAQQAKPGEIVWVHPRATALFDYYFERFPLADGVVLINGKQDQAKDMVRAVTQAAAGKTVYVLATEPYYADDEIAQFAHKAQQQGWLNGSICYNLATAIRCQIPAKKAPTEVGAER